MNVLFNFRKPAFVALSHSVVVLRDRAYLLLSWRMQQKGALMISGLRFRSHKRNGSAYIRLPSECGQLELRLCTLWRSTKVQLPLKFATVGDRVDIRPEKAFRDLPAEAVYRPVIRPDLGFKPAVNPPAVYKVQFHTINLQYDN